MLILVCHVLQCSDASGHCVASRKHLQAPLGKAVSPGALPAMLPPKRACTMQEAAAGGFFSYAAGVAYKMLVDFGVGGLEVDNYRTTLPLKKGLSSSAAFCVLVSTERLPADA